MKKVLTGTLDEGGNTGTLTLGLGGRSGGRLVLTAGGKILGMDGSSGGMMLGDTLIGGRANVLLGTGIRVSEGRTTEEIGGSGGQTRQRLSKITRVKYYSLDVYIPSVPLKSVGVIASCECPAGKVPLNETTTRPNPTSGYPNIAWLKAKDALFHCMNPEFILKVVSILAGSEGPKWKLPPPARRSAGLA